MPNCLFCLAGITRHILMEASVNNVKVQLSLLSVLSVGSQSELVLVELG